MSIIYTIGIGVSIYNKIKVDYLGIILWFIPFIFIYIIPELNPDSNTKIELDRKHNLNFYQKNKDKILLGSLMAIIGSLITLTITYFLK
ncbi:MAG: hypothetical protein DRR11_20860 [Gammaproteobacteria bacterium]|nr:MAG: hypothetical protein DRR11_20860 [Gammaproteobacteria bacterium]